MSFHRNKAWAGKCVRSMCGKKPCGITKSKGRIGQDAMFWKPALHQFHPSDTGDWILQSWQRQENSSEPSNAPSPNLTNDALWSPFHDIGVFQNLKFQTQNIPEFCNKALYLLPDQPEHSPRIKSFHNPPDPDWKPRRKTPRRTLNPTVQLHWKLGNPKRSWNCLEPFKMHQNLENGPALAPEDSTVNARIHVSYTSVTQGRGIQGNMSTEVSGLCAHFQ